MKSLLVHPLAALSGLIFFASPASADDLKVVTYNIRQDTGGDRGARDWSRRAPGVVTFLKEGDFSLIGLQEVKHNQLRDLEKGLPGYTRLGVGRADGKKGGEYSPVFYRSNQWKADAEKKGTFWLSDTPEKPGSMTWGNQITRICTWVRLIDRHGRGLYLFNTHWDHQSQPSREKAAVLILERIKARKHPGEPVILMGDFNANTQNPAIKTLLASGLMVDPGGEDQKLTFNFWKPGLRDGLRIDHVFNSRDWPGGQLEVVSDGDPVHSDHHPVILTLPWGEKEAENEE